MGHNVSRDAQLVAVRQLADYVTGGTLIAKRGRMSEPRPSGASGDTMPRGALADVLGWQSHVRVMLAALVGAAGLVLGQVGELMGSRALLIGSILGYAVATVVLSWLARREMVPSGWAAAATVVADLSFVFGATVAIASPIYYDRILLCAFFIVHLAEFYFGRRHALLALILVVLGYGTLIAVAVDDGAPLRWAEELWSIGIFAVTSAVFVLRYGDLRRRLGTLVSLFERAEEGDFTHEYDVAADERPDAITLVGRAYNRFRNQLASLVLTDPLTGCLNRRGFDQALAREVARAERAGSEVSLLALDLDHFKTVNDTFGHLAGDAVLFEAGALLMHSARAGDVVARTGGEEFSILLPDTGAAGAFQLASRICDTFRAHDFMLGDVPTRLTISIGIVTGSAATGTIDNDALKRRADEALYSAKRSGRDRVRVWTEVGEREGSLAG
jgi:diguanylate cyclase (GGDEF)-like protein